MVGMDRASDRKNGEMSDPASIPTVPTGDPIPSTLGHARAPKP